MSSRVVHDQALREVVEPPSKIAYDALYPWQEALRRLTLNDLLHDHDGPTESSHRRRDVRKPSPRMLVLGDEVDVHERERDELQSTGHPRCRSASPRLQSTEVHLAGSYGWYAEIAVLSKRDRVALVPPRFHVAPIPHDYSGSATTASCPSRRSRVVFDVPKRSSNAGRVGDENAPATHTTPGGRTQEVQSRVST